MNVSRILDPNSNLTPKMPWTGAWKHLLQKFNANHAGGLQYIKEYRSHSIFLKYMQVAIPQPNIVGRKTIKQNDDKISCDK